MQKWPINHLFFLLIGYQRSELTWCWRVWSFGEYWGGGGSENVWHASLPTKFFVEGPLFIEVMGVFFFQLYIMLHVHVYRNSFTETEF